MDPESKLQIDRFNSAAQLLVKPGTSRRPGGKAGVLFAGGGTPSTHMLEALSVTASEQKLDIVYLEFRMDDVADGPRKLALITPRDGLNLVRVDCAFWAPEDGGPLVIVPLGGGAGANHIAIENGELVRRPGLPAPSLADGLARAMDRLRATAVTMPGDKGVEIGPDLPPPA